MIGKLSGKVEHICDGSLILNVNNVGYQVVCPATLLSRVSIGEQLSLFTEVQIREQQQEIQIFGFETEKEKALFSLLRSVSGVGSKLALATLSFLSCQTIVAAIKGGRASMLLSVPGIGKRVAERMVLELKSKLSTWPESSTEDSDSYSKSTEAAMALSKLGIPHADAMEKVQQILGQNKTLTLEELIKLVLQGKG